MSHHQFALLDTDAEAPEESIDETRAGNGLLTLNNRPRPGACRVLVQLDFDGVCVHIDKPGLMSCRARSDYALPHVTARFGVVHRASICAGYRVRSPLAPHVGRSPVAVLLVGRSLCGFCSAEGGLCRAFSRRGPMCAFHRRFWR